MRPSRKRVKGSKGSKSAKDIDECGSLSDTENYVRDEMGVVRITPAIERVVCHPAILAAEDTWRRTTSMLEQLAMDIQTLPSQAAEHPARYSAADKLNQDITQQVGGHIHILTDLRRTLLLPASDLSRMATVLAELQAQLKQLELYERELRHLATPYSAMPYAAAALVIVQQPFPKIMKQNGSIIAHDEHLAVRLLSCARTRAVALGSVNAELRFEDYQFKTVDSPVENNNQPLDGRQRANFDSISFPQGSRGKAVRLHFSVQVAFYPAGTDPAAAIHNVPTTLQSDPSAPFVVLTNESQWEAGAGMLLQKELYPSGSTIVSWPFFANVLQMHYTTAMRQDPMNVQRPLSKAELAWIHETRLEGKASLHMSCFEQLWEWLGKVMQKLRHQRLLNALWLRGYIFGFCQKAQAEALLSNHTQGAFLLRFAENSPGAFAVAYVSTTPTGERLVKHYLIKPEDTPGPNGNIAEFLHMRKNFQYLLQRRLGFNIDTLMVSAHVSKADAFGEYLQRKKNTVTAGYEDQLSDRD